MSKTSSRRSFLAALGALAVTPAVSKARSGMVGTPIPIGCGRARLKGELYDYIPFSPNQVNVGYGEITSAARNAAGEPPMEIDFATDRVTIRD